MNLVNDLLQKLTALVMAPFMGLPGWVGLVILSAISGVFAAVAFRYTSPQGALKKVADDVRANLLAMRLFNADIFVMFRTQGALLKASGLRLFFSLPPLVALIVPFVLLLGQMGMYYEFAPLTPAGGDDAVAIQDRAIVELRLAPQAWDELRHAELVAPDGVAAEIAGLPDNDAHTLTWRLRPTRSLDGELRFRVGDHEIARKRIAVRDSAAALAFANPKRVSAFWSSLLYPGEPTFSGDAQVQGISINYPHRSTPILGVNAHWLVTFFVVSILAALAVKPWVKVQF